LTIISEYISALIYTTYIREAVVVEETQDDHTDIFAYAERSTVSEDYGAFIDEFLRRICMMAEKAKFDQEAAFKSIIGTDRKKTLETGERPTATEKRCVQQLYFLDRV